jgi:Ion channel
LLFANSIDDRRWHDSLEAALYISVITMPSTSYGDITPAQANTRKLAWMRAITGPFF